MNRNIFYLLIFMLSGCAGNQLQVLTPNQETGMFKTSTVFDKGEVKIFEPISNFENQKFIVVNSFVDLAEWKPKYVPYINGMLTNSGFTNLITISELENIVISKKLGEKIHSIQNKIGMNLLSKHIGPYLYIEARLNYQRNDRFAFEVIIFDPVSASVVFSAQKSAIGYVGIQGPLLSPMFNEIKKWIHESKSLSKDNKKYVGHPSFDYSL